MKILPGVILLFINLQVHSQTVEDRHEFTIAGILKNAGDGWIILNYISTDHKLHIDSSKTKKGRFFFKGLVPEPSLSSIRYDNEFVNKDLNYRSFFLEPGKLQMVLTLNNFENGEIAGSKSQNELDKIDLQKKDILSEIEPIEETYSEINNRYRKNRNDDILKRKLDSLRNILKPYKDKLRNIDLQYITAHPTSYVSSYLLKYNSPSLTTDSIVLMINQMSAVIQSSESVQYLINQMKKEKNGQVGTDARDFSTYDVNSSLVTLSQFRSKKYLLLDFWGSWCLPCRHNHVLLRKIYEKYQSNNFEIIGVASDSVDAWRSAIKADSIESWINILSGTTTAKLIRGEYDENDLTQLYGVGVFPTSILIDLNGRIIGRYDGVDNAELDRKLAEILPSRIPN